MYLQTGGTKFNLDGYNSFWFSRSQTVVEASWFFVKKKWLVLKHEICFSHAETIALLIESDDFGCFLLACYRPLSQSVRRFLDDLKHTLLRLNNRGQFFLAGYMNIDIETQDISHVCDYVNMLAAEGVAAEGMGRLSLQSWPIIFFITCQFGKIAGSKLETDKERRLENIDNNVLDRLISSYDCVAFLESV